MLTLPLQPISAALQPFATPPPPTPSPLHTYPLQPIHRTSRSHLCRWPYPPHSALLLPILHTTIPTMASTTTTPPGASPYLPLPPLSLTQLRLRQALFQHSLTTPMLPPTRPLLHRLHQHWHPPSGTQPARQAQTTPKQHTSLR